MRVRFGDRRLPARFWAKVTRDRVTGCWIWGGSTNSGYGHFGWQGSVRYTHRVAFEVLVGPVRRGLCLDHLCRVRACCNPAHLEPVTPRENSRRGLHASTTKTACVAGHPFDGANTYVTPKGFRQCRECNRARTAKYRQRQHDNYNSCQAHDLEAGR